MTTPGSDIEPAGERLRVLTAAAQAALTAGQGVTLHTVMGQMRTDGHDDLADNILSHVTERAMRKARTDPVLFALLLAAAADDPPGSTT